MDSYFNVMATALLAALMVTMKCWENCQLLQSNFPVFGAICDEKGICFPGCEEACQFHVESGDASQRQPVIQTPQGEGVIRVSGGVASWPRPQGHQGPLVYVLMRRVGDSPWRQISQGLSTSARVPPGGTLRVLVVDRKGLVTIYRPSPGPSSRLEEAREVLQSLGRADLLTPPRSVGGRGPLTGSRRINTEIAPPTTSLPVGILEDSHRRRGSPWTLREVSLIHQKVLVIAEIAWEPQPPDSSWSVYFVTWEVDGGNQRGNLITDTTSVTLSLWPDAVFIIQVELANHEHEKSHERREKTIRSQELIVDTSRAVGVEWDEGPRKEPARERRHELALGAFAALALFALVLAALLACSRRVRPKVLAERSISRVFPPKVCVGLLSESQLPGVEECPTAKDQDLPRGTLHV